MSQLTELLSPQAILLDAEATDWREAIRLAGRLLEQGGSVDSAYTTSMVDSVVTNGPYIVVAPGFAFAHARPCEAVHRTAMSWVRLREPVRFGHASNDPVSLVVALAATDSSTHTDAMRSLATVLATRRDALDQATSPAEIRAILDDASSPTPSQTSPAGAGGGRTKDKILTVCGNGLGTSLFLKNTLEQVLTRWGWAPYLTVEATDTISARGRAGEADLIMTSGEIARTLGDVGIPVHVIKDFTSTTEIDAALRTLYDV